MSRLCVCLTSLLCAAVSAPASLDNNSNGRTQVIAGDAKVTLPQSWLTDEIRGRVVHLDSSEVARSKRIVAAALAHYPQSMLDQNLASVYIVKEMSFYGVKYGGTNSRSAVYIANRGARHGFSDSYIASTLHHEFSSVLLRNYSQFFDEESWRAANRTGDQYKKTGTQSLLDGTAETRYSANYHVSGFLNQYGTSSVEEDFNTFAEALFSGDARFWRVVDAFPRIKKKKDLIVAFYRSIDPSFEEGFFRSLASE